jgi:hypothetical protein
MSLFDENNWSWDFRNKGNISFHEATEVAIKH